VAGHEGKKGLAKGHHEGTRLLKNHPPREFPSKKGGSLGVSKVITFKKEKTKIPSEKDKYERETYSRTLVFVPDSILRR